MAVHDDPCSVSSNPGWLPVAAGEEPAATQAVADGQATSESSAFWLVAAPAGSGAWAAVHDEPQPISSSPWLLPVEPPYCPTETHRAADGQATWPRSTGWLLAAPAGPGALAADQDDPCAVSSSPCALTDES